jgi:2-oxoglutarate/2-oxoacid ferredoxin oxidoreductase subunit beta
VTAQDVHSELGSTTRSQLAGAARLQPPGEGSPESATQPSEPVEEQGSAPPAERPSTSSGLAGRSGLAGVPLSVEPLTRKDFTSDQEVRWCPGCGDYAVLAAFQGFMPELGIKRENTVIVSGIGCSSRFPYYVDSYGMHSIHGRATAIATGVATAREDVAVFVITGDGDALSIGGNHLIHVLRRNVNLTILLFNNRIYGLTKGQYSPTSELGKITKSTPMGSLDNPFNPVSLALGAEATFVARTIDSDRKHLTGVLRAATAHRGTSLVEIYQNCPIFNDGAFDAIKEASTSADAIIPLSHGEPVRFGVDGHLGVVRDPQTGGFRVAEVADVGVDALVVHDAHHPDPTFAFGLSRLTDAGVLHRAPIGIFRDVEAPTYDDLAREQVALATGNGGGDDALQGLVSGADTWRVR